MRFVLQSISTVCVAVALSFTSPLFAQAEGAAGTSEMKPIVTVTTGPVQDVLDSAENIAVIFEKSAEFGMIRGQLKQLDGLDLSKPIAFSYLGDGTDFLPVAILPISDMQKFGDSVLPLLAPFGTALELKKIDDNRYSLESPTGMTVVFLQCKGWVVATIEMYSHLLPEDPAAILAGLEKGNVFAIRFDLGNTSYDELSGLLAPALMVAAMNPDPKVQQAVENFDQMLQVFCDEYEMIREDFKLDAKTGDVEVVVSYEVKPGGFMAKTFDALKNAKTAFGGFFDPKNAVGTLCAAGEFDKDFPQIDMAVEQYNALFAGMIEQLEENDDQRSESLITVAKTFRDLYAGILKSGKSDMAATLFPNGTVIAAAHVGDGQLATKLIDDLVGIAKNENAEAVEQFVKRDYTTVAGYKLSSVSVAIDEALPESQRPDEFPEFLAGKNLTLLIGLNDANFCFAAGLGTVADIEADLKKAIEGSTEPQPVPKRNAVFSTYRLAKMLKNIPLSDKDGMFKAEITEMLDAVIAAGEGTEMYSEINPAGKTMDVRVFFSGKHFPLIKKAVDLYQAAQQGDAAPATGGLRPVK